MVFMQCRLAYSLGIADETLFLPSLSDGTKDYLLQNTIALVYTPVNEHFGITPLEAMAVGRPVVSCNSGGPCETIIDGETGFLVTNKAQVRHFCEFSAF